MLCNNQLYDTDFQCATRVNDVPGRDKQFCHLPSNHIGRAQCTEAGNQPQRCFRERKCRRIRRNDDIACENKLAAAAKRKAKGYRTKRNLKTIVYLIAGDVLANSTP